MKRALLACWLSCLFPITAAAATKTWTGAVSNLWSVGGNWTGGAPVDGDQLVFPDGASNPAMSNDLSGLDLFSISFPGTSLSYNAGGNAITLASGMTTTSTCCRPITWSIPITLAASQTFGGSGVTFAGPIDLNGFALTIVPQNTVLSGSLAGSGSFTLGVSSGGMHLIGTSTFSGTFIQFAPLDVTGSISGSTMTGSSILSGTGTLPALTFSGIIRPGQDFNVDDGGFDAHSTGILSTGSLTLNHIHDPSLAIDIQGTTPGTGYDRLAVTGTVTLNNPTLQVSVSGTPSPGQSFVIISNDGADAVSGTFSGLPEGATVPGTSFTITYVGGDGNDVALIVQGVASKSWTGAVSNLWSVGGNWSDSLAPVDGDELTFPDFASNRNMTNDLSGLDLSSIHFTGTVSDYSAAGNAITLANGITTVSACCRPVTWSIPITLAASQSFGGWSVTFAAPIDLNGNALTIVPQSTTLSGSLIGSGSFTLGVSFGGMRLTGTSTFSGTFTQFAPLDVTGSISNSTMSGSSILSGTGTLPALTFNGIIRPGQDNVDDGGGDGHATGILSTGSLTLNHFHDPSLAIDIQGITPGTGHDQLAVTGTVTLNNPTLQVSVVGAPSPGQTFVILSNDGADAVSGTFSGLPEGATVTSSGTSFTITYVGGNGNDVALIVQGVVSKAWTGAVSNLWSVGGNWSDSLAPVDGDQLTFPDFASNRTMTNDLSGLDLSSIHFTGTVSDYSAAGNAITLANGMATASTCCRPITWSIPITLAASQTFGGSGVTFAGPIDLNSFALTIVPQNTLLSGSLIGSGSFTLGVSFGGMRLTGTSTFSGTFSQFAPLDVTGSISNSTMSGSSILSGTGTLPALTFNGIIRPGQDFSVDDGGFDTHSFGILSTGSLTLNHFHDPSLAIDIQFTTPGSSYDQLGVTGTVTLNNPTLQITVSAPLSAGQTFVIISNDGADAVSGTFSGLPEGAALSSGGTAFRISYIGGDGNDVVLTVLAATTTVLTVSPTPVVTGEPFGVSATVSSSFGTPTGTVQFKEGATTLATAPLDGSGVATAMISLPAGTHSIVAVYEGAGAFASSTSAPVSKSVGQGNTSTTLTNAPSIIHGDALSFEVDVAAVAPATGVPTGTVTVSADGQTLSGPLTGGEFASALSSLTPGIHPVSANYGGDANFLSSSTSGVVEVLARITSADVPASEGSAVNVVVTLSGASNQTVTVDYTTANGTAMSGSDYVASLGTVQFAPGVTSQTIAITINGDGDAEPQETVRVLFSNPQHAVLDDSETTITISNAVAGPAVPALSTLGLILLGLAIAAAGMFMMRQ